MVLNVGAVFGYLSFGPLADRVGRRPVFGAMCVGSLVMLPITFLTPRSYFHVLMLLPLLGFFNNGIFSGFSNLPAGIVSDADSGDGCGVLFQCRTSAGVDRSFSDRLSRHSAGELWTRRQCGGGCLHCWAADPAIRARDKRQASAA